VSRVPQNWRKPSRRPHGHNMLEQTQRSAVIYMESSTFVASSANGPSLAGGQATTGLRPHPSPPVPPQQNSRCKTPLAEERHLQGRNRRTRAKGQPLLRAARNRFQGHNERSRCQRYLSWLNSCKIQSFDFPIDFNSSSKRSGRPFVIWGGSREEDTGRTPWALDKTLGLQT